MFHFHVMCSSGSVRLHPPGTYITVPNTSPYLRFGTTGSRGSAPFFQFVRSHWLDLELRISHVWSFHRPPVSTPNQPQTLNTLSRESRPHTVLLKMVEKGVTIYLYIPIYTYTIGVTKPPYKMVHSFLYKMQIQGAFYNGPCWQILLIPALNSLYKRQLVGDTLDRDHIFKVIWYLAKHVVKILFGIMMEV